jgi:hypothetical protein
VFVVGCGRSGTTLLRLMLDAHPDLAIPPESHFLSRFGHALDRYAVPGGGVHAELLANDVLRTKTFRAWEVPDEDVLTRVRSLRSPSFADVVDAVYTAYAEPRGASRWGDKTPRYVLDIPLFDRLFPGSRFVHIIRDGRDVAMSLRSVRFGPNDPMGAAGFWERRVRAGMRDGGALGGRYHEVRYEALVADPERELRAICAAIDLPWDPAMLDYPQRVPSALPEDRRSQHRHEDRPPTAGLRDWRTEMPPADVAAFEAVAGRLLDDLGYERGAPPPSTALRTKAAWHRASGKVKRRLWRVSKRNARRDDTDDAA